MPWGYGWKPDPPDHRDQLFQLPAKVDLKALPTKVDLRSKGMKGRFDQGDLGSCTAQAGAYVHLFDQMRQKSKKEFVPSRLFLYYNTRGLEGNVNEDTGASIRATFQAINQFGVCPEPLWPYDPRRFTEKPPTQCYAEGLNHQSIKFQRVIQSREQLKGCLAAGRPIEFGFTVYQSFESNQVTKTGMMPMPRRTERPMGGHAVVMVGYDDETQRYICVNSWSEQWGDKGDFYMPYEFAENQRYAQDFWTLEQVEVPDVEPEPPPVIVDPVPIEDMMRVVLGSQVIYLPAGTNVTVEKMQAASPQGVHFVDNCWKCDAELPVPGVYNCPSCGVVYPGMRPKPEC